MNIDALRAFTDSLHTEVAHLRHRGLSELANMVESIANDHREIVDLWYSEELTLHQAAEESGYSYDTLQQMKDINSGDVGSPRILRCDLPYKHRPRSGPRLADGAPDLADEILVAKLNG